LNIVVSLKQQIIALNKNTDRPTDEGSDIVNDSIVAMNAQVKWLVRLCQQINLAMIIFH